MEWVNIQDKMPRYGEPVILCIDGTVQNITFMLDGTDENCCFDRDWFEPYWYDDNENAFLVDYTKVIYWMRLPGAPYAE